LEDIQNDFLSLLAVQLVRVSPSHQSQSCHYLNNNTETMEQQLPQPEYVNSPSPEALPTSQPSPLVKLPPAPQSDEQRRFGTQISDWPVARLSVDS